VHGTALLTRLIIGAAFASAASASNIVIDSSPDISASGLAVAFAGGELTVNGFADSFTDYYASELTLFPITSGTFSLTAQIDSAGVASGGTFQIAGYIYDGLGEPVYAQSSGILLSGSLTTFAFDPFVDAELDFFFSSLSGDIASLYGDLAIVKLNLYGFPGTFGADFLTDDFSNVADVGVAVSTPEPGSWLSMAVGSIVLVLARRRRSSDCPEAVPARSATPPSRIG